MTMPQSNYMPTCGKWQVPKGDCRAGGGLMRLLPEWIWGKQQLNAIEKKSSVASRMGWEKKCTFFNRWSESRQDGQMWTLFLVAKVVVHLTNTRWGFHIPNEMPAVWEKDGVIMKPAGHHKHCWLVTSAVFLFCAHRAVYYVRLIQK